MRPPVESIIIALFHPALCFSTPIVYCISVTNCCQYLGVLFLRKSSICYVSKYHLWKLYYNLNLVVFVPKQVTHTYLSCYVCRHEELLSGILWVVLILCHYLQPSVNMCSVLPVDGNENLSRYYTKYITSNRACQCVELHSHYFSILTNQLTVMSNE